MRKLINLLFSLTLALTIGSNIAHAEVQNDAVDNPMVSKTLSYFSNAKQFDSDRYAAEYPDVATALGMDRRKLFEHFKAYGVYEGRRGYTTNGITNAKLKVIYVANEITNNSMTDREKVAAVYDWIIQNARYDDENYYAGTIPPESYMLVGIMNKGIGVCSGYASTFDFFMEVLGIPCKYVDGIADGEGGWGGHAWNMVTLDHQEYWLDVTWDDCLGGSSSDGQYFLISYEEMSKDHKLENTWQQGFLR